MKQRNSISAFLLGDAGAEVPAVKNGAENAYFDTWGTVPFYFRFLRLISPSPSQKKLYSVYSGSINTVEIFEAFQYRPSKVIESKRFVTGTPKDCLFESNLETIVSLWSKDYPVLSSDEKDERLPQRTRYANMFSTNEAVLSGRLKRGMFWFV